ncbi:uncharacterized protein [Eucyclogobius newberryi]|uniref:uncharacterized protein n=1 Tax=Eucyclogobius newberryi TaxID=166745 RepID=UPI003B591757
MVPGRGFPAHGLRAEIGQTEGNSSLKPERLPQPVPVCGGNAIDPDLINSQPVPAAVPAAAEGPLRPQRIQSRSQTRPGCPQCGRQIPESQKLRGPGGSSLSVHSRTSQKSRSKGGSKATLDQPADDTPGDVCLDLLLSCLFCHCSALLLGLLDLCSSGFSALCFGCGEGCCCSSSSSSVRDVTEEEEEEQSCHTHCQSVVVQCCEPVEFLEFCLECCQICHRS